MPCDYKQYPKSWKRIRAEILYRADNCCENCGVENYAIGFWLRWARNGKRIFKQIKNLRLRDFQFTGKNEDEIFYHDGIELDRFKIIRIVLTIAHLNHKVKDNRRKNLKALCQRCHLNHDREFNLLKRRLSNDSGKPKSETGSLELPAAAPGPTEQLARR